MSALALLAACGGVPPGLNDPRSAQLLAMPEPQFVANRVVSLDLTNDCTSYDWNAALDIALNANRAQIGTGPLSPQALADASNVEVNVLRRSLSERYGRANACKVLDGERSRRAPLSVLVEKV